MNPRELAIRTLPAPVKRGLLVGHKHLVDAVSTYRATTGRIGPLPSFLIIGGQKCGTTYLYDRLLEHPSVRPALTKEINFFSIHYSKGVEWYRAHFASALDHLNPESVVVGEASGYVFHPNAPRRIADVIPNAKLILLLREPVARAYSHYHHVRRLGFEPLSTFEEAISSEEERLQGELERELSAQRYVGFSRRHHSYLARGQYADQLDWWFDVFDRENLLILHAEDLYRNPKSTLITIGYFLGLPQWEPAEHVTHKKFDYPGMNPGTREGLRKYFRPHNERLFDMLGVDYGWND